MKSIVLVFLTMVHVSVAATVTVTTTNDSGPGSLRQAMVDVMASAPPRLIHFNIAPTGATVHAIHLLNLLPALTNSVLIDGTTQPGYSNAPRIKLVAADAGVNMGLQLNGGTNRVRGLELGGFNSFAIAVANRGGSQIDRCHIIRNNTGVLINNTAFNVIGGGATTHANVIGANSGLGVQISGGAAMQNLISGNLIGTDRTGMNALPNTYGLLIGSPDNVVGGTVASNRNIISGNRIGVYLSGSFASGNLIAGNYIGPNVLGTSAIPGSGGIRRGHECHPGRHHHPGSAGFGRIAKLSL